MNSLNSVLFIAVIALVALAFPGAMLAQGADEQMLLHPPADSWPGLSRRLFGQASQRSYPDHAAECEESFPGVGLPDRTDRGKSSLHRCWSMASCTSPFPKTSGRSTRAPAIRSGTTPIRDSQGEHIGHRGVAMYKGYLFFLVSRCPSGFAECAKTERVRWNVQVADVTKGYWTSMAPLVVGNHVLVGVSGDFDNLTRLSSGPSIPRRAATQWQWDSTPPAGTPNQTTGGMTWMTGTYDPDLNLVYWGTGNPTPVLNGSTRPGDDLYTCSIVALNPDTGKLVWAFQVSPHDTHDWDAVETPVLVDGDFHGEPKKMLMQTSRNGYFFVLDRTNGKNLIDCSLWAGELDAGSRSSKAGRFRILRRNLLRMDA